MNYKRKGHRGRHKTNTFDNQGLRFCGNSASKQTWLSGRPANTHLGRSQRNRVETGEA